MVRSDGLGRFWGANILVANHGNEILCTGRTKHDMLERTVEVGQYNTVKP